LGDLNGDFLNDRFDFALFKTAYEEANGAGSFRGMFQVPEPVSLIWLLVAVLMVAVWFRLSDPRIPVSRMAHPREMPRTRIES
jgi:hypothetical protein